MQWVTMWCLRVKIFSKCTTIFKIKRTFKQEKIGGVCENAKINLTIEDIRYIRSGLNAPSSILCKFFSFSNNAFFFLLASQFFDSFRLSLFTIVHVFCQIYDSETTSSVASLYPAIDVSRSHYTWAPFYCRFYVQSPYYTPKPLNFLFFFLQRIFGIPVVSWISLFFLYRQNSSSLLYNCLHIQFSAFCFQTISFFSLFVLFKSMSHIHRSLLFSINLLSGYFESSVYRLNLRSGPDDGIDNFHWCLLPI